MSPWGGGCDQGPPEVLGELPCPTPGRAARASLCCQHRDGSLAAGPGWGVNATSCPHRLFGFSDIILYYNCSQPNTLELNTSYPWTVYANPGILLLLYYSMATLVKLRWRDAKVRGCRTEPHPDGDNGDNSDSVCLAVTAPAIHKGSWGAMGWLGRGLGHGPAPQWVP